MKNKPYIALCLTVGVHFFIMLALTYIGVNALSHVYLNLNRFYMAIAMVAPMVVLMLALMWKMYDNKKANIAIIAFSIVVFAASIFGIRAQVFVENEQFLKSMIPHHSIAIKTCNRANITDSEIKELCDSIVETQREEINQMKKILNRID